MSIDVLKKWMQDNLRMHLLREYEYLKDYFEAFKDEAADYIILISRRCYILYQMFAFAFGWNDKRIISDKGMWRKREDLSRAMCVIIADDVMFTGDAMNRILEKLDAYLKKECERNIAIFCRNNDGPNEIKNYPVKSYSVRTKRDCRKLTNRLVKSIQANGIPYAVFVYPLYGWQRKNEDDFLKNIQRVDNENIFDLQEDEWESEIYFNFIDEIKVLKASICDEVCLRVYRKDDQKLICMIPFAFVSNIKKEFVIQFFTLIQECFRNSGGMSLANEIGEALKTREIALESEKYTYLAAMLACSLSRVIGLLLGVENEMYEQTVKEVSDNIIRGSFSDEVVNELNNMNREFAVAFIRELDKQSMKLQECVQKEQDSEIYPSPCYACYEEIVKSAKADKKCGDVLIDIFEKLRENYENKEKGATKYIFCNEIMSLLKEKYSTEEIHAAEIKVWDQGIATYDFYYDDLGVRSRCGIGERSQLIFSLKYQSVLKVFFEQLPYGNGSEYTQQQINEDVNRILDNDNKLSLTEKEVFRQAAQEGVINLYNYFINI
ncbi:MAG: hypothetical protein K2K46_13720 [Lachnospiraceae bacterium]|nr:hypothetical protein [Lachnospiraceae bacterium]